MPIRFALGTDHEQVAGPLQLRPLDPDRVTLVGARDLDPAEAEFLSGSAVRQSSVIDLTTDDLPDGPLLLHLDLDVIDSAEVGGLRYPVAHGPSRDEVLAAVRRTVGTGRVVGIDVACPWHPATDERQHAARQDLIAAVLDAAR